MLTHIDANNQPTMVDVGDKAITARTAVARSIVVLPPEVQALVNAGQDAVRLPRSEAERHWLQRWLATLAHHELPLAQRSGPELVEHALRTAARPLPGCRRHEVGAGYVDPSQVWRLLTALTPGRLALLLCSGMTRAHEMAIADTADRELGALWDASFVQATMTWFHDGHRLKVAKVF